MSLTAADIFENVVRYTQGLKLDISSIENELIHVLQDISGRGKFLFTTATVDTVADTATVTLPTGCKLIDKAYITAGNDLQRMLWETYRREIQRVDSVPTGEPTHYCQHGSDIVLDPTPDAVYTISIDYHKYHAASTTIEFSDEFKSCITYGVLQEMFLGQLSGTEGSFDHAQKFRVFYEDAIAKHKKDIVSRPQFMKYNDR